MKYMCGIFALLNNDHDFDETFVSAQFEKGKMRGPEYSELTKIMIKAEFGFHRLAINGLNPESNQPIIMNDIAVICNGEIYNYKDLYEMMDIEPTTDSDCEVIVHLYREYGIAQTLQMLDGVFAFILIDYRIQDENAKIYVARDPYGVRPLYHLKPTRPETPEKRNIVGFASELKVLNGFYQQLNAKSENYTVEQFEPGTYSIYQLPTTVSTSWRLHKENIRYHSTGFTSIINTENYNIREILDNIQYYLTTAVHKRCSTTDRPIACLLSGGLDSSLITALVVEYHKLHNLPVVETYSIGLEGSVDLAYARTMANYLGTNHTEIVLQEEDFLNAIPEVIKSIESYDTTSVRASIGNWLLGKYIAEHSDAKVIFNGDGSDELTGGYLYMHKAPGMIEFDGECRRLLKDIHAFDVLRSDKSISSHGLEPRTPFLDRTWVQYYLSIPLQVRYHPNENNCEKYLLRMAFSKEYYETVEGRELLPHKVLWRKKEAFSDGVSKHTRSLYKIIQEYTEEKLKHEGYKNTLYRHMTKLKDHLLPQTSEQIYYRSIFESEYGGLGRIVPYFWMPKYVEAKDASARTLELYQEE
jgi:asparagine synthase (glutamine-hydrolysing)